ncbi:MAG: peptide chain release factor N(5)-glutamine methyltransferase [Brachymonas sp.]|nr:peptide chain release factor N(5)-glutamine methyltransferase [Brachymonas sp.]
MHDAAPAITLISLLREAQSLGMARLDAQMLLLHACGHDPIDRAWLLAHADDILDTQSREAARQFFARRMGGEPVAYIIGCKEFYGLRLNVDWRVLDPRDDTETLVDWALDIIPAATPWHVLDLGTGSGAIALAVASQRPQIRMSATDASADALVVAQTNAVRLQLSVQWIQADAMQDNWFAALGSHRFDLILSNPPYIADTDAHLAALAHEPSLALTSGADGLDAIHSIISHAPEHLHAGAWLLIEHGHDQAQRVQQMFATRGFAQICTRQDMSGNDRCTGACLP